MDIYFCIFSVRAGIARNEVGGRLNRSNGSPWTLLPVESRATDWCVHFALHSARFQADIRESLRFEVEWNRWSGDSRDSKRIRRVQRSFDKWEAKQQLFEIDDRGITGYGFESVVPLIYNRLFLCLLNVPRIYRDARKGLSPAACVKSTIIRLCCDRPRVYPSFVRGTQQSTGRLSFLIVRYDMTLRKIKLLFSFALLAIFVNKGKRITLYTSFVVSLCLLVYNKRQEQKEQRVMRSIDRSFYPFPLFPRFSRWHQLPACLLLTFGLEIFRWPRSLAIESFLNGLPLSCFPSFLVFHKNIHYSEKKGNESPDDSSKIREIETVISKWKSVTGCS